MGPTGGPLDITWSGRLKGTMEGVTSTWSPGRVAWRDPLEGFTGESSGVGPLEATKNPETGRIYRPLCRHYNSKNRCPYIGIKMV